MTQDEFSDALLELVNAMEDPITTAAAMIGCGATIAARHDIDPHRCLLLFVESYATESGTTGDKIFQRMTANVHRSRRKKRPGRSRLGERPTRGRKKRR